MSEVEKMYENAKIEKCNSRLKEIMPDICLKNNKDENYKCEDCEYNWYPEFTAEKQLSLIKWLMHKASFHAYYTKLETDSNDYVINYCTVQYYHNKFESALSALITDIWQDLTESEQEQIRSILE